LRASLKGLISFLLSASLLLLVTVALTKYGLGNPLAGLGSKGFLSQGQASELERSFGLNGSFWDTLKTFLISLTRGGPPSVTYSEPSLELVLPRLCSSLSVLLPSYALSLVIAVLVIILTGFRSHFLLEILAFVPEYFYAVLLYLSSWSFGWPNPLPQVDQSKVIAYSMIIVMSEFPKFIHSLTGLYEDSREELRNVVNALKAMGLSDLQVNLRVVRVLIAPFTSHALYALAMLLERTVLIEPFISFPGVGNLLYRSVINADVFLAATSFMTVSLLSLATASMSPFIERILDPRLRA